VTFQRDVQDRFGGLTQPAGVRSDVPAGHARLSRGTQKAALMPLTSRFSLLAGTAALALALTACGGGDDAFEASDDASPAAGSGESITVGGASFTE